MHSERAFPWRAFLIALAVRLALVLALRTLAIGLDDMFQYDMLARSLVSGNGFRWYAEADLLRIQQQIDLQPPANYDPRGMLTSFRAPLYPAFLALLYWLGGVGASRFFVARLAQALLNALLVPLTYALGRRLFPGQVKAARWAAWAVAFYPLLIIYPLALATENLFFLLLLLSIWGLVRAAETRQTRFFLLAGLCLGLTALTRSVILPFGGLAALWAWFLLRERRRALLFLLVLGLTVTPWVVRNSLLHGRLTGIETSLGYNLYVGYHPQGDGSFAFGPSLDLLTIFDDAERDEIGTRQALEFIQADPARFPELLVRRLGHFFGLERRALTYFYANNFFGYLPTPLLLTFAALILTPFCLISLSAVFGLTLVRWNPATLLLPLVTVTYLAPHLFLLSDERFHYALVPFFALWAALAWERGCPALAARWRASRAGQWTLALAGSAALLLCLNWVFELWRDAEKLTQLLGPLGHRMYFPY